MKTKIIKDSNALQDAHAWTTNQRLRLKYSWRQGIAELHLKRGATEMAVATIRQPNHGLVPPGLHSRCRRRLTVRITLEEIYA